MQEKIEYALKCMWCWKYLQTRNFWHNRQNRFKKSVVSFHNLWWVHCKKGNAYEYECKGYLEEDKFGQIDSKKA